MAGLQFNPKGSLLNLKVVTSLLSSSTITWKSASFRSNVVKLKVKLGAYADAARGLGAHLRDIGP